VTTHAQLEAALKGNDPKIVLVQGTIKADAKTRVGNNKSVIGKDKNAHLVGNGFNVYQVKNVIIRNLKISKVQATYGDGITIQKSTNVWVDHCDLSSDRDHGKDYYDGLLDVVHGSDFVTVTNTHFHDHFKGSLVGHASTNAAEDRGHLRITFANNWWTNVHSRTPSIRFGTGHVFNSYFDNVDDGINTRDAAQVLVQDNVFKNATKPLYSTDAGYAVQQNNDFGKAKSTALAGKLTAVPYRFQLEPISQVRSMNQRAGNNLVFH
jgi:pectate lyase